MPIWVRRDDWVGDGGLGWTRLGFGRCPSLSLCIHLGDGFLDDHGGQGLRVDELVAVSAGAWIVAGVVEPTAAAAKLKLICSAVLGEMAFLGVDFACAHMTLWGLWQGGLDLFSPGLRQPRLRGRQNPLHVGGERDEGSGILADLGHEAV